MAPETDNLGTQRLAARIARAVGDVTVGVETIRASVGIAIFPGDGVTAVALLHAADQRLLSHKRERQSARAHGRAA